MHGSLTVKRSIPIQPIEIQRASSEDQTAWDRFADVSPSATFFHRHAWADVIRECFGHRPEYLLARRGGQMAGILPLMHKSSPLFGQALISTPFLSYGGVATDDPAIRQALESHAVQLAEELGVQYLELRNRGQRRDAGHSPATQYATFLKDIPQDMEQIIRSIPAKGRRHDLKRSLRQDLVFEAPGRLKDLYEILAESFRNLGTPIFPRRYFDKILTAFPRETEVCTVKKDGRPISAALVFSFRDHVQPFYAGGRRSARDLHANDFLFLNIMLRARVRGYAAFDFGRSKVGSGAYAYKSHWGFEAEPLAYEYRLIRGTHLPDISPQNPRYKHMIALWQRLPLVIANVLGPRISGHFG